MEDNFCKEPNMKYAPFLQRDSFMYKLGNPSNYLCKLITLDYGLILEQWICCMTTKNSKHFWVIFVYQDQMKSPIIARLKHALSHLTILFMYSFLPMPCVWSELHFCTNLAWFPQSPNSLLSLLRTELLLSGSFCLLFVYLPI